MNNEPYGWVKNGEYVLYIEKPDSVFNYIPLYTHPVKELTDDKIADLIKATNDEIGMKNIRTFDFTKVLLRKAQE